MWKKVLTGIAVVVVAVFAFLTWFRFHYSMGVAASYEVNAPDPVHNVLIATQGSPFKDAVVTDVVDHLKQEKTHVKVIDVSGLPTVDEGQWDAVVILHTWEYGQPQADAKAFVDRAKDKSKLVVLGTSGQGTLKMEGVDAISSASVMTEASSRAAELMSRVDEILGRADSEDGVR